jgi:hypothetical protein
MDWVSASFGIPAATVGLVAVVGRVIIAVYALRGTEPKDRPAIIRALGRMYKDARPELPRRRQPDNESPAVTGGRDL